MKSFKAFTAGALAFVLLATSSCGMTNTGKGALIGGGGGAALGAGIGALIGKASGKAGKGAAIGAAAGAAVGAGAGALIGNKMDKQKKALEKELADANVETVTDVNGYQGIKVTFPGGILFPTNGTTLSADAKAQLAKFASSLVNNPMTNVQIYGFTDNTGSMSANQKVSTGRADAVENYLKSKGVATSRMEAQGVPMAYYVATNDTPEGRAQNRRVEIYITADDDMIKQAEAGSLK